MWMSANVFNMPQWLFSNSKTVPACSDDLWLANINIVAGFFPAIKYLTAALHGFVFIQKWGLEQAEVKKNYAENDEV